MGFGTLLHFGFALICSASDPWRKRYYQRKDKLWQLLLFYKSIKQIGWLQVWEYDVRILDERAHIT